MVVKILLINDFMVCCLQVFLRNRSVRDLAEASKVLLSPTVKIMLLEIVVQIVFTAIGIVFKSRREKSNHAGALEDEPPPSSV